MEAPPNPSAWNIPDLLISVADHADAIIFVLDNQGNFRLSLGKGLQKLGVRPGQMVGRNAFEVYAGYPDVVALLEKAMGGVEVTGETQVGELHFSVQYSPVFRNDRLDYLIGIALDITARKNTEAQLRQSETQFRNIVDHSPMGMHLYILEPGDRLVFAGFNPSSNRILGRDCSEFVGQTIEEAFPYLVQTEVPDRYRRACRDGEPWKTTQILYESETIRGAYEVHAFQIYPGAMCALFLEIGEYLIQQQKIKDLNEKLEERVRDRTRELEESNLHLRQTEKELYEAENMSSLGRMVAGVAHEINTPLGISVTDASFLEDIGRQFDQKFRGEGLKRSDVEKFLGQIRESAASLSLNLAKAARLVESFKSVAADRSSEKRRVFFVGSMVEDILLSMHNRIKQTRVQVHLDCPAEISLDNYPGAFNQVLTNLLMNSLVHAFEPSQEGSIHIGVTADSRGIVLKYGDSGRGVPVENLGRIFEPFYTTKRGQGGTGLGLSILWNLVCKTMGGTVKATSPQGQGLRFEIFLPHLSPGDAG